MTGAPRAATRTPGVELEDVYRTQSGSAVKQDFKLAAQWLGLAAEDGQPAVPA